MKTELRYLAIFGLSAIISIFLFFRIFSLQHSKVTSSFISSCQEVATSLLSTELPLTMLATYVILALTIHVITSIVRTNHFSKKILSFKKVQQPNIIKDLCIKYGINDDQVLVIEKNDLFAITMGALRQRIVISSKLISTLNKKEIEAVFIHELHHYKNNHGSIVIFAEIITNTLFFIPILKDVLSQMKLHFEQQADISVIIKQQSNHHIKSALATIISYNQHYPENYIFPRFAAYQLSERVASINSYNHSYSKKQNKVVLNKLRLFISLTVFGIAIVMPGITKKISASQAVVSNPQFQNAERCTLIGCVTNCISQELPKSKLLQSTNLFYSPLK